jgi:hypothetical protein
MQVRLAEIVRQLDARQLRARPSATGSRIRRLFVRSTNGRGCSTVDDELKHVPDASSYAPVTVFVDERADSVHLSYDKMADLLAPNTNGAALMELDRKVEKIMQQAAA